MSTTSRRTVHRPESQLAYYAAGVAMSLSFDTEQLRDLAELTFDLSDVAAAVIAMRVCLAGIDVRGDDTVKRVVAEGKRKLADRTVERSR